MEKMINFQHEAFTETASKYPDNVCLLDGKKKITYSKLDNFSNKIANFLIKKGIKPNDKVCLILEKNFNLYASILGVLKAGGCWVPINKVFHFNRISNLIEKINPIFIICSEQNINIIDIKKYNILSIDSESNHKKIYTKKNINIQSSIQSPSPFVLTKSDLAYIMFTSGSTGKPKGVMVTHGNTSEFLNIVDSFFSPKKFLNYSHISEITFDPSIFDIFVCWKNIGTIVPFNKKTYKINPNLFFRDNKKIDVVFALPSLIDKLDDKEIKKIKYIMFTGEPLFLKTIKRLNKANKKIECFNLYGSTETSIISHYYKINKYEKNKKIPVGKLLPNFRCKLIDKQVEKNTGECYVCGPQVSIGYYDDKVSNEKYFLNLDNDKQIKYYNIGDILKYEKKENIYKYIGRTDDQIKINGIRLDLQELDSNILSIEGVVDVCSISGKKYNLKNIIKTYIQVTKDFKFLENKLIQKLREDLPFYMVPKEIVFKQDFPRTLNGKIDREKLLKNEN
jgi:amino acid adenylation domain-containing protein